MKYSYILNKKNVIFFTHHKNDEFTNYNFKRLYEYNASWDIIPIGFKKYDLIPGSVKVLKNKYPTNTYVIADAPIGIADVEWTESDLLFYEAHFQYPNYEKYFFIEWDCVFNTGIDNFFPINKYTAFGNNIENPASENWNFVKTYKNKGGKLSNLASYGQSCCIFFTNDILKSISREVVINKKLYCNMFSELRGGTLIKKYTELVKCREDIMNYIYWNKDPLKFGKDEYFYHPIKNFNEYERFVCS